MMSGKEVIFSGLQEDGEVVPGIRRPGLSVKRMRMLQEVDLSLILKKQESCLKNSDLCLDISKLIFLKLKIDRIFLMQKNQQKLKKERDGRILRKPSKHAQDE